MSDFDLLQELFGRAVCQRATRPLKRGAQIAVHLGEAQARLRKTESGIVAENLPAEKPDMTFFVPSQAIQQLHAMSTEDIGEIGVEILKLMANPEPEKKIRAKVHIGPLTLFLHGYLGVLPLGGPTVMKFLGTKGLTNIGKIKDAISKLKE